MDSSSDGSFAWTEASDDSTENEMLKTDTNANQSSEESESGKSYKKKLQQQLLSEGHSNHEIESNGADGRPRKRKLSEPQPDADRDASPTKKRIKTEPESDVEKPQVNKHQRFFETHSRNSANDAYDESYLDLQVKKEHNLTAELSAKRKRKRNKSESTNDGDIVEPQKTVTTINNNATHNGDIHHEEDVSCVEKDENDCDIKSRKKKKKSKKRRKNSEGENSAQENISEGSLRAERTADEDHAESPACNLGNSHSHAHNDERRISDGIPSETRLLVNSGHTSDKDIRHQSKSSKRMKKNIDFNESNDDLGIQSKSALKSSKPANSKKSKLNSFVESSAHLRSCRINLPSGSVLGDDDDIWVIQCPKDVEIEAFQGKEWAPASGRKIKLDGRTYEGDVDDKRTNLTVLSARNGRGVIRNVAVAGCIRLRGRIPKSRGDTAPADQACIPLPATQRRHPFFGLNYKSAIRVPAAAAERLRARPGGKDRRKSPPPAPAPPASPPTAVKKKKKKKKRGRSPSAERAPAWDSAKAIEETLFSF